MLYIIKNINKSSFDELWLHTTNRDEVIIELNLSNCDNLKSEFKKFLEELSDSELKKVRDTCKLKNPIGQTKKGDYRVFLEKTYNIVMPVKTKIKELKRVILLNHILEHVGYSVFQIFNTITEIDMSYSSTTSLPKYLFAYSFIQKIQFPPLLSQLSTGICMGCEDLKTVVHFGNIESVGKSAFQMCSLTEFAFPESLKIIGDNAFTSCPLTCVDFSKIEKIGNNAFSGTNIKKLVVSSKCKEIGSFDLCQRLSTADLSKFSGNIDNLSFACCFVLKHVTINSQIKINRKAFDQCYELQDFAKASGYSSEVVSRHDYHGDCVVDYLSNPNNSYDICVV